MTWAAINRNEISASNPDSLTWEHSSVFVSKAVPTLNIFFFWYSKSKLGYGNNQIHMNRKQNSSYNTAPLEFPYTNVGQHVQQANNNMSKCVQTRQIVWYKPSTSGVINMGFRNKRLIWMICADVLYSGSLSKKKTLDYWLIGFVWGKSTVKKYGDTKKVED